MAQLCHYEDQIRELNTEVGVITFGTSRLAQAWIEETGAPYPLLLDPDREAYEAYGLERSWLRSWGLKNIWYYAKAVLSGRSLAGIQGDSAQLGGDFIVDRHGIIRLAYPSHDPTDRPPIRDLLAVLRELHQKA